MISYIELYSYLLENATDNRLPGGRASWDLGKLADDCELVVSELTANVTRAATGPDGQPRYDAHGRLPVLWSRLLSDRARLWLEAWGNLAPELGAPIERRATDAGENGRGLELVGALSRDWGGDVLPGNDAKRVWAYLAWPASTRT